MNKKYEKYANLLLTKCLSIKKGQPLLISAPIDAIEFVRIINKIALENGITDIYYDLSDETLKHDQLKYLKKDDLKNSRLFNKKIWDEYAKKDAAFLMLCADNPDIMKDIDCEILAHGNKLLRTTKTLYKKRQLNNEISWCIACVSTDSWAKKVFPDANNPKEELWNAIFKMCLVDKKDPIHEWEEKTKNNNKLVNKLNKLDIVKLNYKNSLGTNFEIGFDNNIWYGTGSKLKDGRSVIVNMPTEEVFTTPDKYSANGIVYASLPLVYNGSLIENFYIEFKNGKVINYDAKKGKEALKSIIETKNGNYLGEVALVDITSPISKSNILFYDTLYDENASCHLAVGSGFLECIKDTKNLKNFNESKTHVDFMIGTKDLEIIAETKSGKSVTIMKNGKFTI